MQIARTFCGMVNRFSIHFTSPHLSSSCRLAFKALIHCFHLTRSLATVLAEAQLFHPSDVRSVSTVRLQVVLGRPTFLFPSGFHVSATEHILLASILSTWPIHLQRRSITSSLSFFVPALMWRFSFEIVLGHLIFNICLRHLF